MFHSNNSDDCKISSFFITFNFPQVPIGTVLKNVHGKVVGDMEIEDTLFVAARGGAGGHGNYYFRTDVNQTPQVAEYGGEGETIDYFLEMRSMADVGLVSQFYSHYCQNYFASTDVFPYSNGLPSCRLDSQMRGKAHCYKLFQGQNPKLPHTLLLHLNHMLALFNIVIFLN